MRSIKLLPLLLALSLSLSGFTALADSAPAADIVFVRGVIYTADSESTIAEALAIAGGKIAFVGSNEDAQAFVGPDTVVKDLNGGFMMPGLIDAHIHSIQPSFFDIDVVNCLTLDELIATIKAGIAENPDKPAYYGFGYSPSLFEGIENDKGPRKELLDELCPDKPLSIFSYAGHDIWCNSKYFEVHGITADTPSPQGGTIEKDEETGELWGTLKDAAMILDPEVFSRDKMMVELPKLIARFNSLGFTSILSVSALDVLPVPFESYAQLEQAGQLTIKMHGTGSFSQAHYEQQLAEAAKLRETYNTDLIKMNTLKVFLDGAVDTRTAFLLSPYENTADNYGQAAWTQEVLNEAFAAANEQGFQLHAHALGDGAVRMGLDAFEYARDNAPAGDYRNVMTHLQLVSEADKPRLAELDINVVAQPAWHYRVHNFTDIAEGTAVGAERVERFYPMKSLKDAGALIAASSDFPFTIDPNPFIAMQVGVTRNLPDGAEDQQWYDLPSITDMDDPKQLLAPEERLTIEDMIRAYTINAAYTLFAEDETGSLEVGKAADLVIVDQNLLTIDPLKISHTTVLETYVNGQRVY